jgi:GTPase SAR1 family protein
MPPVVIVLIALVAASFVGVLALIGVRAARLTRELEEAEQKIESLTTASSTIAGLLTAAQAAHKQTSGWFENSEQEVVWMKAEIARRPKITPKVYKILTLGIKATGKTSLTLKWSNPLTDLGTLEGTKIERYQRTVSLVLNQQKDEYTQHIFEVHDWGGEHIVDAQQELIVEEINGLLLVVDLGGRDAKHVDPNRIHEQLQEFQAQALKYFFGPKTVTNCNTVVLFINKSDLLAGTPTEVQTQAEDLYAPLIANLKKHPINLRVFVGSANYGHSTHLLFSHFVERILPRSAYDRELMQRANEEFGGTRAPAGAPAQLPPAPTAERTAPPASPTVEPGMSVIAPLVRPAPTAARPTAGGTAAPGPATTGFKKTMPLINRPPGAPPPPPRKE